MQLHLCLQPPCPLLSSPSYWRRRPGCRGSRCCRLAGRCHQGPPPPGRAWGQNRGMGWGALAAGLLLSQARRTKLRGPRPQNLKHRTCSAAPFSVSSLRFTPPLARSASWAGEGGDSRQELLVCAVPRTQGSCCRRPLQPLSCAHLIMLPSPSGSIWRASGTTTWPWVIRNSSTFTGRWRARGGERRSWRTAVKA